MIKEKSQLWAKCSHKIGKTLARLPISPNFITWASVPCSFIAFACIVYGYTGLGLIIFIFTGLLDILDGPMARYRGTNSAYGAFLDGSLDRLVDFLVIFSYFWLPITTPWLTLGQWIALTVFLAIIPSFEVAYANHRGAVEDPEEKRIWRILNRGEMYFLMMLVILLAQYSAHWAGYALILLIALSAITSLQTFIVSLYLAIYQPKIKAK